MKDINWEKMFEMKQDDWIEACDDIEALEAKLKIAVEALNIVDGCNSPTCNCKEIASETLAKIGEENGNQGTQWYDYTTS